MTVVETHQYKMKASGYLTAAAPMPPPLKTLRLCVETASETFGSSRRMFDGAWSACPPGGSPKHGSDYLKTLDGALTPDEQNAIWVRTAMKMYRL